MIDYGIFAGGTIGATPYVYNYVNRYGDSYGSSVLGDGGGTGTIAGNTQLTGSSGILDPVGSAPYVGSYSSIHFGLQADINDNLFYVLRLGGATGGEDITIQDGSFTLNTTDASYGEWLSTDGLSAWYWPVAGSVAPAGSVVLTAG